MTNLATISDAHVRSDQRHLVDDELWDRLVNRVVQDEAMERPLAERIVNETLRFLRLAAEHPAGGFSPSPLVDIGWHTFILYTREYAAFCDRIAARFIHHSPKDGADTAGASGNIADTAQALRSLDGAIDEDLWAGAADLSANCNSGDGKCCSSPDGDSTTTGN